MGIRKHIVTFYSPGTVVSATSDRLIAEWSPGLAAQMATGIKERHGATPYGFCFRTLLTADPVPDGEGGVLKVEPKAVAASGMYFLTGTVLRYEDIPDTPDTHIIRTNMRWNGYPLVVENRNSYRSTFPFIETSVIVDRTGKVVDRGDAPRWMEYRARIIAEWHAEGKTNQQPGAE